MAQTKKSKKKKRKPGSLNFDPQNLNKQLMPIAEDIKEKLDYLYDTYNIEEEEFAFPPLTMEEIIGDVEVPDLDELRRKLAECQKRYYK